MPARLECSLIDQSPFCYVAFAYRVVQGRAGVVCWHDLRQGSGRALEVVLNVSWDGQFGSSLPQSRLFRCHHEEER
jgi:hypothetical protein